jgi:hypothetical protein
MNSKVSDMKKEYDFSQGVKSKFYVPLDKIEIPIYLDKSVKIFYEEAALTNKIGLSKMVNSILKKEMEIHKEILIGK